MEDEKMPKISIVLPCRNEEQALPACLDSINEVIRKNGLSAEVIVSDSSSDNSPDIALAKGAILRKHDRTGYGRALMEGFEAARGKYVFMADADLTYDFREIPRFINYLERGYDLVIGNRFRGKIIDGAMPWLHRHFGSPLMSFLARIFFRAPIHDVHCGMRALKRAALENLDLRTAGMEFASEMAVKAGLNKLRMIELPISYYPRKGESKLMTFRDGWRHLRFMLIYSPLYLFFIPGSFMFSLGVIGMFWLYFFDPKLFGITLYGRPLIIFSFLAILGFQLMSFDLFARTYAMTHLGRTNNFLQKFYGFFTLEKGIAAGLAAIILGLGIFFYVFAVWLKSGFGALNEAKNYIAALTISVLGLQVFFSSFMLSILSIKEK